MIYSRWDSHRGGYDYFEVPGSVAMGNDLPVPSLPRGTSIGVSSIEAGRPIPSGAKKKGHGELAVGLVAPIQKSALGDFTSSIPSWSLYVAIGVAVGWHLTKRKVLK